MKPKLLPVLGLTALFAVVLPMTSVCAEEPAADPAPEKVGERTVAILVGGLLMTGYPILPATDTEFKLKMVDTGDVITMKWSKLDETQRKEIQKAYGLTVVGDEVKFGDKIKGVRITLERGGNPIEGFPLLKEKVAGMKVLRTANNKRFTVPIRDIKHEEEIEVWESDFFSNIELFDRWKLEKPPGDDATAHLEFARKAASIRLYKEALEELKAAEILDPRTADRNQEDRQQWSQAYADQQTKALVVKLMQAVGSKNYFEGLEIIDKLDRNFPYSDMKSRWDGMRAEVEQGAKTELKKNVIQMAYSQFIELIEQKMSKKVRVDEKGNEVPSVPGKMITCRNSSNNSGTMIFKGTLMSEDGLEMVIRDGDAEVHIQKKQVISVSDIDLSKAYGEVEPTYDQLKDYVTDTGRPDGLKNQMIQKIAQRIKKPEAEVKAIFEGRMKQVIKYDDDGYNKDKVYTSLHDVLYGKGSWLRDGQRPMPIVPIDRAPAQRPGQRPTGGTGGNGGTAQAQAAKAAQQAIENDPDLTDDPLIWWKFQPTDVKYNVLKGLGAEKIFSCKVWDEHCPTCRSNPGKYPSVDLQGVAIEQRCPTCRGIQKLFKVTYQ